MALQAVSPDYSWWIPTQSAGNKDVIRQTDEQLAISGCLRSKLGRGGTIGELPLEGGRHGKKK